MTTIVSKERLNPSERGHKGKREVGPVQEDRPRWYFEFLFILT